MLKWKTGGTFTHSHSSQKIPSPSPSSKTTTNAKDLSNTTTISALSITSALSTNNAAITNTTTATNSPSISIRSSCSSTSSVTNLRHGTVRGGQLPSESSGPNKSFLHQSFVSGSCPSDEYYDGSRLSTLARKHQFERQLSIRSAGSVDSYATLTPVREFFHDLDDSDEDILEETEESLTKEVLAAIHGDHYSMPMNNSLVSTVFPESTANPPANFTPNPTPISTSNPTPNLTPNPTPSLTPNPTPNLTPNPTPKNTSKPTPKSTIDPTSSSTTDLPANTTTNPTASPSTANIRTTTKKDTTKSSVNPTANLTTNLTDNAPDDAAKPSTNSTINLKITPPDNPADDTTPPDASTDNLPTRDTVQPTACLINNSECSTSCPSTDPDKPHSKTDFHADAEETDVVDSRGCTSVSKPALHEASTASDTQETKETPLPPGLYSSVEDSQDVCSLERTSESINSDKNADALISVNPSTSQSNSVPRMYYYGLEPDIVCAPTVQSHYAIPKGNKPVHLEVQNAQSHHSPANGKHSDRRNTELSEIICRHYDVPKNIRKSTVQEAKKSEVEASKNESEESKDGKSSKKHRMPLNIRKAFGQHSKTLRRLKEFVRSSEPSTSTSSTTREAQADEDHYKSPKKTSGQSVRERQQQYSKTLPIIRRGKKKGQRVSVKTLMMQHPQQQPQQQPQQLQKQPQLPPPPPPPPPPPQLQPHTQEQQEEEPHLYESFDFSRYNEANESLKLALDFRDAKSYVEVQEIRKSLEKGGENGEKNSENFNTGGKSSGNLKGSKKNSGITMTTDDRSKNIKSSEKKSEIFFKSGKFNSKTIDNSEKRSNKSKIREKGSENIKMKEKSSKNATKNCNASKNGKSKHSNFENHNTKETHPNKDSNHTKHEQDIRLDREDHLRGGGGGGGGRRKKRRKEGKCEVGEEEEEGAEEMSLSLLSPSLLAPPLTHYHTFPRRRRPPPPHTSSIIASVTIPDGAYVELFPFKNMSALQLAAEGRDYLMWCPDQEFDNAVSTLDIRGLVELVQTLQDAMAVEQQTFDSLSQQLEVIHDPLQQQRLSAALCTSQTRLARLCSRNMRCFRQQALKVRQKEGSESRSSSPRDSGLTMSSAAASDTEGDPRSPVGPSFKNSLAFFQRAAHLVANNAKNTSLVFNWNHATGARQKETRRRSSRGSSCYGSGSSSSEAWSVASDDQATDYFPPHAGGSGLTHEVADGGYEDDLGAAEDPGTYEQVLFINGRPQYQDDLSWSGKRSRSNSWTRLSVDGSSSVSGGGGSGGGGNPGPDQHHHQPLPSVAHTPSQLTGLPAAPDTTSGVAAAEVHTQTQAEDVASSFVTPPRRKPYLNFKSVASSISSDGGVEFDHDNLNLIREKIGLSKNSALNTLTRAQSFKEGLNAYTNEYSSTTSGLSRTQSFNDGLANDLSELGSGRGKLQRAPSVDEILESVKYLRAKKTMVKSNPDLASVQEPVYSSASLPRHKSSKGKAPRVPGTSSLLGVKYNGHSNSPHYERVPEPDYEQIPDSASTAYYENVCKGNNHYENIHLKGEVIYDSPRPTNTQHHYDKVHNDLHYENVKYDAPVYENLDEKEPTYMNINDKSSNIYSSADTNKRTGSLKSLKSRSSNKVTVSGNSMMQGATYDVPRAATHIYDSPQKQVRSVSQANEYDTPKNNRSVLPQSTQIVLKAKNDQKKKIDDIFADCDQDSLDGERDREPDIPSPDYGSEEEEEVLQHATNDYVNAELPDEGLGESDNRSYYTEDPAGLEVILEEPEEEYCSSHASEDDLQREVDITYELKGERRSLDGSEGIGSAEGDTQSSGGSEHYGELEDCASSGIHSEDTPSPGPPVDSEKDRHSNKHKREEDRTQKDRCVEVYPETVRQRQRNMMAAANKVDIKNWSTTGGTAPSNNNNNNDTLTSPAKVKKFLPSVKALRSQFEAGKTNNNKSETNGNVITSNGSSGVNSSNGINGSSGAPTITTTANNSVSNSNNIGQSKKTFSSTSSLASSTLEKTSSTNSLSSPTASVENLLSHSLADNTRQVDHDEPVEPIYNQFKMVDEELRELMSKPPSTSGWNPRPLLKRLYYIPEAPRMQTQGTTYINIEGYLEKLPSGRKKATFWNAWKRRYFVAKDGILYYYQGNQTEKPSMKMTLMGGRVESMEPNMVGVDDGSRDTKASSMLGIDDGKGHYVVVRCSSRQEAERWRRALETHTVEDFASQYVQPWPVPTNPTLLRDTLVIDIGSSSIRAGILASQATLPQLFMPSVVANSREGRRQVWGFDALAPDIRSTSTVAFPIRPSHKISKYSVDLSAVSSLLQKTFADLKVDPKNYHVQLSVPRVLNTNTQAELLRLLFDKHGVRSVNLTHQSILALYAYNATSGIVVDVGERMDIVPVIDGYIVDGGVSRVPYGGYRILDHLRQFLYMRNVSLINEVESYIIRHVLENICYCAHHYNTEKARCTTNSDNFEKSVSLAEYFSKDSPFESIALDFGRFQATEGLFNPDAWGLDHPGLHKLVHKAIMECSMDIRKEMSRSIFLAGGVTQLPGLVDRLTTELDNLTPPAIRPKVHASPYRYHAAYIGACVLAESPAFAQSRITREDWNKYGNAALRKWSL